MLLKSLVVLLIVSVISYIGFLIFINVLNFNYKDTDKQYRYEKKVNIHVPKFMMDIYEKNKIYDHSTPDVVRSLIPEHTEFSKTNEIIEELIDSHILVFNLPMTTKEEHLVSAELKIFAEVEINCIKERGVKKIFKISVYNKTLKKFSILKETKIHHFNNTWLSFNLTEEVNNTLFNNDSTLKIKLKMSSFLQHSKNNLKLSLKPKSENIHPNHPVLLLYYSVNEKDNNMSKTEIENNTKVENKNNFVKNLKSFSSSEEKARNKRNIQEIEEDEEETNQIWNDLTSGNGLSILYKRNRNNCKKKPLYIDFKEIEYDLWIVQPPGYEAYQCQGRCFYPVAQHLNPTKHAIMQALVHSVSPLKASRSCCVPTELGSISILYVDDKGVLTYRYAYKDMVVKDCGCR